MFTGLVEEAGRVVEFREGEQTWRLVLESALVAADLAVGDSLACNGACLTVVENAGGRLSFDLLDETVRLTSFAQLAPGSLVNLERALRADARLGGHFVSGHVDATGEITVCETRGHNTYLRARAPEAFAHHLVYKGSICLDGVSLTVAEAEGSELAVWLIPHTLEVTNLREKRVGDRLNLEFDLLAKYVEKMLGRIERPA